MNTDITLQDIFDQAIVSRDAIQATISLIQDYRQQEDRKELAKLKAGAAALTALTQEGN